MAKKFDVSTARRSIKKGIIKESRDIVVAKDGKSKFYREYYDLETGKPIEFDKITNRIKKRFREMDKLSVLSMLDLYFVHQNWQSFYNRQESFKKYLADEIQISKSHAYGILTTVEMLKTYYDSKTTKSLTGETLFVDEIAESVEGIGIKKLRILTTIKDKSLKNEILTKLIDGEKLTSDEIVELTKKTKPSSSKTKSVQVTLTGTNVSFKKQSVLNFDTNDNGLIKAVVKTVQNYYMKVK